MLVDLRLVIFIFIKFLVMIGLRGISDLDKIIFLVLKGILNLLRVFVSYVIVVRGFFCMVLLRFLFIFLLFFFILIFNIGRLNFLGLFCCVFNM